MCSLRRAFGSNYSWYLCRHLESHRIFTLKLLTLITEVFNDWRLAKDGMVASSEEREVTGYSSVSFSASSLVLKGTGVSAFKTGEACFCFFVFSVWLNLRKWLHFEMKGLMVHSFEAFISRVYFFLIYMYVKGQRCISSNKWKELCASITLLASNSWEPRAGVLLSSLSL